LTCKKESPKDCKCKDKDKDERVKHIKKFEAI